LQEIIPADWLDRVLGEQHLASAIRYPVTTFLLRDYIAENGSLPPSDYALFQALYRKLEPVEALNLQAKAWDLFGRNAKSFSPDDALTDEFCRVAVSANVLTPLAQSGKVDYRFVHERIHRFLVALFLDRQDPQPLDVWHGKLAPGFGKGYWADVLEFMAAKRAVEETNSSFEHSRYASFIREAAVFAPHVFAERLYEQYQRYAAAGMITVDPSFDSWAAGFMTAFTASSRN
jgi:hypothetical protein